MFMFKQVNITITTEIINKGSEVVSFLHDICLIGPQTSVCIIPSRSVALSVWCEKGFLAYISKTTVPKISRVQVMLGSMRTVYIELTFGETTIVNQMRNWNTASYSGA